MLEIIELIESIPVQIISFCILFVNIIQVVQNKRNKP
jgi:hypothetical protein